MDVTCAGNTAGAGPPSGNEPAPGHAAIRSTHAWYARRLATADAAAGESGPA